MPDILLVFTAMEEREHRGSGEGSTMLQPMLGLNLTSGSSKQARPVYLNYLPLFEKNDPCRANIIVLDKSPARMVVAHLVTPRA